jgi:exosortase
VRATQAAAEAHVANRPERPPGTGGAAADAATWGHRAWITLPFLAAGALYVPLLIPMAREWIEFPNLSHGLAIPFIAAYLLWARRDRFRSLPVTPTAWGALPLVAGLAALVIGVTSDEPFLARLAILPILIGLVLFLAGPTMARTAAFGLGYLVFMIPPPWSTLKLITYRSRLLDAEVSAGALSWLGVPVYREGVLLHLPNITLEVADECSSIPAIAALLALGVAYAALARRRVLARVILVAITLPLAITANIVRIISVSWAAYAIGPWTLSTSYHMFNGTVNFLFTFCLLVAADGLLARLLPGRTR